MERGRKQPKKCIDYINNVLPSIKFTHETSKSEVNFLDTTIIINENGDIETDVYQKPTDTHAYLHWTSAHPPHLKRSKPYSQALRLRRICSDTEKLKTRINEYTEFFVACSYDRNKVYEQMQSALAMSQEECLEIRNDREPVNRIHLVTTFNPHITYIAEIANRNWSFLKSKERLARIFDKPPLIAYRRPKSFRDTLLTSTFKGKPKQDDTNDGCGPCGRKGCSWCKKIKLTTTFTDTKGERTFQLCHDLDSHSAWVIYMIECKLCKLPYIGKSETGCNIRFNNDRSHIRNLNDSCELSEHFLHNRRTHDFERDIAITPIEQIRKRHLEADMKKDLLKRRELFWQLKLNTMQPPGLNKRKG